MVGGENDAVDRLAAAGGGEGEAVPGLQAGAGLHTRASVKKPSSGLLVHGAIVRTAPVLVIVRAVYDLVLPIVQNV